MTDPTFHHVALLVPNMEAAIERFSETLGISFRPPRRMITRRRIDRGQFGDDGIHEGVSHLAWSIEGPPYYELIEAQGGGLHSMERNGPGLLHVGRYVPDVGDVIARLAPFGLHPEAQVLTEHGAVMVCWMPPDEVTGLRIEYMDESLRAPTEAWIKEGRAPEVAGLIAPPS